MPIELYWSLPSQPSRALKAFMDDSGLPYTDRHLDIRKGEARSPEILKLNPAGTVPFLVIDGRPMVETVAIMRYLTKAYPQYEHLGRLYPGSDVKKRYNIDRWCDFYTSELRPAFTTKQMRLILAARSEGRDLTAFDKMAIKQAQGLQDSALKKLETQLRTNNFKFVCGNVITMADYLIFAELQDAKYLKKNMNAYPTLAAYEQNVMAASNGHYNIHKDGGQWATLLPEFQKIFESKGDPDFTLYYFPGYGRVEPIRLMLEHAGANYDYVEIEQKDWPAQKAKFKSLPAIELPNGKIYNQTNAIMRYFGMKYGYYPLDLMQQYECDSLADFFGEIFLDLVNPFIAPDDASKKAAVSKLFDVRMPYIMKIVGPRIAKGGWLVGNRMSTADFYFGNIYASISTNRDSYGRGEWAEWLKAHPGFEAYGKRFCAENQKWLDKRQSYPL